MIRTQIQLPERLYRRLKRLAELEESSLAAILRRAGEREIAAHPELEKAAGTWEPPAAQALGIRADIPVEQWRLLANEPERVDSVRRLKRRR